MIYKCFHAKMNNEEVTEKRYDGKMSAGREAVRGQVVSRTVITLQRLFIPLEAEGVSQELFAAVIHL